VTTTARNLAKSRGVPSTLSNKEAFTADLSNLQMSMKKISDNYLKKMNIDAHEIKTDFVGRNISKYDLYVETVTKEIYIFLKGGKGEGMPTGIYLK
jgi:filamentous hemagglutinin